MGFVTCQLLDPCCEFSTALPPPSPTGPNTKHSHVFAYESHTRISHTPPRFVFVCSAGPSPSPSSPRTRPMRSSISSQTSAGRWKTTNKPPHNPPPQAPPICEFSHTSPPDAEFSHTHVTPTHSAPPPHTAHQTDSCSHFFHTTLQRTNERTNQLSVFSLTNELTHSPRVSPSLSLRWGSLQWRIRRTTSCGRTSRLRAPRSRSVTTARAT